MKEDFFIYLGPENGLQGYVRSYKLVFFKCFFSLLGAEPYVLAEDVTNQFQQYYLDRKKSGRVPDVKADKVIENVEGSSSKDIYNLILKDPFKAISSKGYIDRENRDNKEYFVLNNELFEELTDEDIHKILEIVDKKLSLYFSKIDSADTESTPLRDMITKIMNEYIPARREMFAQHPFGKYFRQDVPRILYDTNMVDQNLYKIKSSVGQGQWAKVPWIAILDSRITATPQEGVYIVYLLSADGKSLYLTLNQGCTSIKAGVHSRNKTSETCDILQNTAEEIRECVSSHGFLADNGVLLDENPNGDELFYQQGTIFYKKYRQDQIPEENELKMDLQKMIDVYKDYAVAFGYESGVKTKDLPSKPEESKTVTTKDIIEDVKNYIKAKGFSYPDGMIEDFYLSIKSKPFVILAGISGTGKTRLVRLFAEAVGATIANGRYKMVPVRPDWSDSSDLFGHVDLNGEFVPGNVLDFVKTAQEDPENPYFLCFDEMNLARVEYYLSDILSVIETRDKTDDGSIVSDPLLPQNFFGNDTAAAEKYNGLILPDNLYIIGTVNMDETTFPFSRKVLDRANTIEFSYVNLVPDDKDRQEDDLKKYELGNDYFKTKYLTLNECSDEQETVTEYCLQLEEINHILQKGGAHVGYRVRDEIIFYLLNNKSEGLLDEDEAFDYELMQKILPRIQGSSSSIKEMLCDLFKYCAGDYDGYQTQSDDISSKMMKVLDTQGCKYKHSAEKIAFMMRRFEEDGFTSYWL